MHLVSYQIDFLICYYSHTMRKKLIINADDFGYSPGVNKGIIEAHTNGVVTSTSVIVDSIAAQEAATLGDFPNLSVGLHLALQNPSNAASELRDQVAKFKAITGELPDHIDVHKVSQHSPELDAVLRAYSQQYSTPIRRQGFAKFIGSYFAPSEGNTSSTELLKQAIDQATDEYNEIMCHVGYCDQYLLEHSSYNRPRELELQTMCSPEIKQYIAEKDLELANWQAVGYE